MAAKTAPGPNSWAWLMVAHAAAVRTSKKYEQSFIWPTNDTDGLLNCSWSHIRDMSVLLRYSGEPGQGEPSPYSSTSLRPRKCGAVDTELC